MVFNVSEYIDSCIAEGMSWDEAIDEVKRKLSRKKQTEESRKGKRRRRRKKKG